MIELLTPEEFELVLQLVARYDSSQSLVSQFLNSLLGYIKESTQLQEVVHSIRSRMKDREHLQDKLHRKILRARRLGEPFDITAENLLTKITDLGGIRILHLHTRQIEQINKHLMEIIHEQPIELIEGPSARTWDDEYRTMFKGLGIETQSSENMYTSVHYVVASRSRTTVTCEIQVRTLMEEVWGEVDHTLNYPHPTDSVPCREQIRALARSTSSATRLVDAIFATVADIQEKKKQD